MINYNIKIIGGKWKNSKLKVINNKYLRPTTNKMRETLFNWLSPIINNSNCLDCFSGSGALGLESLSRGAKSVTFIEKNRKIYIQLRKNIYKFNPEEVYVRNMNVIKWLQNSCACDIFNIVFIDPPFNTKFLNKTIEFLEKYNFLKNISYIYIETKIQNFRINIPYNWKLYRQKITNKVMYNLYIRNLNKI